MRVLILVALASACVAGPAEHHTIVLDGRALTGVRFVRIDGREYFPLQRVAEAAGLVVRVGPDGTVIAGGETFKADVRVVNGEALVSRGDVRRALKATVYVDADAARAVITTERGRSQLARRPGLEVKRSQDPPPSRAGHDAAPATPAAAASAARAAPQAVSLAIESIELDRSVAHNNFLRARAIVRNQGTEVVRAVTVTFVLWADGLPEAPDGVTGMPIGQGATYSEYPQSMGDLGPGQWRPFEVVTSVANPNKIIFTERIIELDVSSATDSFAKRRLRYGFKGTGSR